MTSSPSELNSRPLIAALVLFTPTLPLMLSGAIRAAIGVPLSVGLAAATVATIALLVLVRRHLRLPTGTQWAPLVLGGLAAAWLSSLLINPDLGALATVGGGDAGNHVSLGLEFVYENPAVYDKFVVFHAVAHWLGRGVGLLDGDGFALGFYLIVVCALICTGAVAAAFIPADALRVERGAAWLLLAGLLAAGVLRIWGPWLHYQQADGFYAHAFGLVPLLLGWLAYAAVPNTWGRAAILAAWIGLSRFTYGLNLGDALVAGALLLAWEAVAAGRGRKRAVLFGGTVILLVGSLIAFHALAPLRSTPGGIITADMRTLRIAQAAMVAFLALSLWSHGGLREATTRLTQRLMLFPLLFGTVNLAVQLLYLTARWPQRYYFLKYNLHSVVLLSIATTALLPFWLTRTSRRAAFALPGLAALVLIANATRPQWTTFRERAFGTAPYEHVDALTDRALIKYARSVMAGAHARSGGYLEPFWPRSNFINASLGSFHAFKEGFHRFTSGEVDQREGTCVFWLEGPQAEAGYKKLQGEVGDGPLNNWRALRASPDKQCIRHEQRWRPGEAQALCWRCGAVKDPAEGVQAQPQAESAP